MAAISQHTSGPQHIGPFKMLRDFPRRCWLYYCRISFICFPPRSITSVFVSLWCFQVTFSLTSGNIGRAFEIRTTNNTYGEVFVARPLDRELLDHYTLRVGTKPPHLPPWLLLV